MNLAEYKAKELFYEMNIPIVKGITINTLEEIEGMNIEYPVVVKAQVQTGGRGKMGGVKFAENINELKNIAGEMLGSSINGFNINKVMIVHKVDIDKEYYLSVFPDRNTKSYVMLFSKEGGVDIESTAKSNPEKIFKIYIDPIIGIQTSDIRFLADKALLCGDLAKSFVHIATQLFRLCVNYHCTLVEINPLVITSDKKLIALDAKISVDDSAVCKFPEFVEYEKSLPKPLLVKEAALYNFLYIPCDPEGRAVVMSNGSGMLMSCIDGLTLVGVKVSAALDMGGGAVRERIKEAVRILLNTKNSEILFINIFGGITRCDEVAEGICDAVNLYGIEKPIVVRLEGTNKEKGYEILGQLNKIVCVSNMEDGIKAVKSEVCK